MEHLTLPVFVSNFVEPVVQFLDKSRRIPFFGCHLYCSVLGHRFFSYNFLVNFLISGTRILGFTVFQLCHQHTIVQVGDNSDENIMTGKSL